MVVSSWLNAVFLGFCPFCYQSPDRIDGDEDAAAALMWGMAADAAQSMERQRMSENRRASSCMFGLLPSRDGH
jgi:hypothetical protein